MFFNGHNHTMYSNLRLIDCINKPKDLIDRAIQLGLSGIAITDHECISAHMEINLYAKTIKEQHPDFTIALGNEIYLIDERSKNQEYYHFILIAKDAIGHRGIRELSSKAWYNSYMDRGMERVPLLKSELAEVMRNYKGHIIATTACMGGELSKLLQAKEALSKANCDIAETNTKIDNFIHFCVDTFGIENFLIECAPSKNNDQIKVNRALRQVAEQYNIKMTVATDSHYLDKTTRFAHKAYLNSKDEEREVDDFYEFAYLMSEEEVTELLQVSFPDVADKDFINSLFENTEFIRKQIEWYSLERHQQIPLVSVLRSDCEKWIISSEYPTLARIKAEGSEQEQYWLDCCMSALKEKGINNNKYIERLEIEADVIAHIGERLGTCLFAYFNTFKHYIDLFWECGSIVGPGRGSATGFLSNYLLGITQLDPMQWNLPWWRFLNKERAELPDIDIDLAPSKRASIFEAIRKERGELGLVQVVTFGTEGTKKAIQTACRGYRHLDKDGIEEYPNGIDVDIGLYLSSLIPQERGFLWPINDVLHGNEELHRLPVKEFLKEVNAYPGLIDIIVNIEGLISQRGIHASGVMLYDAARIYETGAIMRAPSGDIVTAYDLHMAEAAGDTKYDFLVTEVSDKMIKCLDLLQKDNVIEKGNLRSIYNKYLHPQAIDTTKPQIWKALADGSILDVFQFNSGVGLAIAKKMKPVDPLEMTAANAMMRLMSEKGKESQQDRFVRIKENGIEIFDKEMRDYHLPAPMIAAMHKYCDKYYGCCAIQEQMMEILMDKDIVGFSLKEANDARKIVAKKQMSRIPDLKAKVYNLVEERFADYIWEVAVAPQLGYAFSLNHSLPYSFVGIQTIILALEFNPVYWNTACLIVNSGALEELPPTEEIVSIYQTEDDGAEYEDLPDRSGKRRKMASTDYGKIAKAVAAIMSRGIDVRPVDINKSSFGFMPDAQNGAIYFGMKGLLNVGDDVVNLICANRPYADFDDFYSKIGKNLGKQAVVSLIKSGAFDAFGERKYIMATYLWITCDKKKRLTLQNMNSLIQNGVLPATLNKEQALYEFNRYLKNVCKFDISKYKLDDRALAFLNQNYEYVLIDSNNDGYFLNTAMWDKVYQKEMNVVRDYLKDHQTEALYELNKLIFKTDWEKYAKGTYAAWEMEVMCFYYHPHELQDIKMAKYGISNFNSLPEEPVIEKTFNKRGVNIPIYKLTRICGTVIAKNKTKGDVTLLTTDGVVNVWFRKEYFALFDKQISAKGADGKKHIIEKSWFNRGSRIIVTGMRRGDEFIPKKYASTVGHQLYKIDEIQANGDLILRSERAQGEMIES